MKAFTGVRFRPLLALLFCAAGAVLPGSACSKGPPQLDHKVVMGDGLSLKMYQRFGWQLTSMYRDDETTTTYIFQRPENYNQSVQDSVAEAGAEAKDKGRLANKDLSEIEKTAGVGH